MKNKFSFLNINFKLAILISIGFFIILIIDYFLYVGLYIFKIRISLDTSNIVTLTVGLLSFLTSIILLFYNKYQVKKNLTYQLSYNDRRKAIIALLKVLNRIHIFPSPKMKYLLIKDLFNNSSSVEKKKVGLYDFFNRASTYPRLKNYLSFEEEFFLEPFFEFKSNFYYYLLPHDLKIILDNFIFQNNEEELLDEDIGEMIIILSEYLNKNF